LKARYLSKLMIPTVKTLKAQELTAQAPKMMKMTSIFLLTRTSFSIFTWKIWKLKNDNSTLPMPTSVFILSSTMTEWHLINQYTLLILK
jgi:hypothetical protein